MKRLLAGLIVVLATGVLSGCYIAPGYSYVQGNGYVGDAYYGTGPAVVYNGYYDPWYGYGYGYGCCWAPGVVVGGWWYGGHYWRGHQGWDGDHDWDDNHGWHGRGGWSHGASRGSSHGSSRGSSRGSWTGGRFGHH